MSIIEITTEIEALAKAFGALAALAVSFVVACEKIARCVPTNFENPILRRIFRSIYLFFAVFGLKLPDVAAIKNGKIVTNVEAIAQKVVDGQTTTAEPKDAVS